MSMSKQALPLASWKTWWEPHLVAEAASILVKAIDVRKLPRGGCLLEKTDFKTEDLRDVHTASVAEGLVKGYPQEKQPSGYFLGDVALEFDRLLNHAVFGPPDNNPIKEKRRRDDALTEGGKMKRLLSFVRTSALKNESGRTCDITYLKQLANQRVIRVNKRHAALAPGSASSTPRSQSQASLDSPMTASP